MTSYVRSVLVAMVGTTYKVKDFDSLGDSSVSSDVGIKSSDARVSGKVNSLRLLRLVTVTVDNDHFFLECEFWAKAYLVGIEGADHQEQLSFFKTNKGVIEAQANERFRLEVNQIINSFVSRTVSAPQDDVDFWPVP